jgi:di/tripeptidase
LGRIIAAIADITVPREPKTTFNVGVIEGGTSVNTIAERASALLDMRSTGVKALDQLAEQVRAIVGQGAGEGLQTEIEILGERPAGERSRSDPLVALAGQTLSGLGIEPEYGAASTDANIAISLNIPAVCVGITRGEGVHTPGEFIQIPPIGDGLAQAVYLCRETCKLIAKRKK